MLALLEAISLIASLLAVTVFASFLFIFYTFLYLVSKLVKKVGKVVAVNK